MHRLIYAAVIVVVIESTCAASAMYWADHGLQRVQSSDLSGGALTDVVNGNRPRDVAIDHDNGHLYWTDFGDNAVRRSNLDGTGIVDLVTGQIALGPLALDVGASHVYYVSDSVITRADLDGSNVTPILAVPTAFGLAIDAASSHLYWSDPASDVIRRSNLDGSSAVTIVSGITGPNEIALDTASGFVYWADGGLGKIQRASLSGINDVVDIVDLGAGTAQPFGIALDVDAGHIYWTDRLVQNRKIQRSGLDGSAVTDIVTGLDDPRGLALLVDPVPEPASATLAVVAMVVVLCGRRRR